MLAPLEKEVEDLIFTEAEVVDLWPEDRDPAEHLRRSLYLFRKRNVRYPLLDSFDAPDTQFACPRRETSTHALQALEPAQQRVRRRPGAGPGRPDPPRGRAGPGRADPPGLPGRPLPRAGAPPSSSGREASSKTQAELVREQVAGRRPSSKPAGWWIADRPGRRGGLGRFRPGDAELQ